MEKGSFGSMCLGFFGLLFIISIVLLPLGLLMFDKWLDIESKGDK